jgi:hypothetical protein
MGNTSTNSMTAVEIRKPLLVMWSWTNGRVGVDLQQVPRKGLTVSDLWAHTCVTERGQPGEEEHEILQKLGCQKPWGLGEGFGFYLNYNRGSLWDIKLDGDLMWFVF